MVEILHHHVHLPGTTQTKQNMEEQKNGELLVQLSMYQGFAELQFLLPDSCTFSYMNRDWIVTILNVLNFDPTNNEWNDACPVDPRGDGGGRVKTRQHKFTATDRKKFTNVRTA